MAERRVIEFNQQNLASTAWGFATLGQADVPLFEIVARAGELSVGDFGA